MYQVFLPQLNKWIFNVPVDEALVYKEEGYLVMKVN